MWNAGLVKLKTPRTWFAVVVAVCLFPTNGSSAVEDAKDSRSPFKDTFIICENRPREGLVYFGFADFNFQQDAERHRPVAADQRGA